ncbi:MAG TPA: hypothetical protein VFT22_32530 [Kofleriaceae bacterium]|nr:hypothetical protein [Kofleriaceae bacterium]
MQRAVIAIALALASGPAWAQPASDPDAAASPAPLFDPRAAAPARSPDPAAASGAPDQTASDDLGDQAVVAELGLAAGGRVTPGGLRIGGQYLYQLSERDWFDGAVSFTFGSGDAACFRDRSDQLVCDHGLADGFGLEVGASVRRIFAASGAFRPFARVGIGFGLARFGDDRVTGFTVPFHGGGGLRAQVSPGIAIVGEADLAVGFGTFGRGLGLEPQLGLTVAAGVEFRLP